MIVRSEPMKMIVYCGFEIAGNADLAIAINVDDPSDCHTFTRDPDCNDNAFKRACGWAFNE
jgi:hypothetical protein